MQGRLLPPFKDRIHGFPADNWRLEFPLARQAGLHCIEWIFEEPAQERNPVANDEGIKEIKLLSSEHNVQVHSICANYYITNRLISDDGVIRNEPFNHFLWLVERAEKLGIAYILLPFLDNSSLATQQQREGLLSFLEKIMPTLENTGIEVNLETDFDPKTFKDILDRVDHPLVKVNYDTGNSASLGYDPLEELTLLSTKLGGVHIKDRVLGGSTVPLGTGGANFPVCFSSIAESGFDRWFILEAARQTEMTEVELAIKNRQFIENQIDSLSNTNNS